MSRFSSSYGPANHMPICLVCEASVHIEPVAAELTYTNRLIPKEFNETSSSIRDWHPACPKYDVSFMSFDDAPRNTYERKKTIIAQANDYRVPMGRTKRTRYKPNLRHRDLWGLHRYVMPDACGLEPYIHVQSPQDRSSGPHERCCGSVTTEHRYGSPVHRARAGGRTENSRIRLPLNLCGHRST